MNNNKAYEEAVKTGMLFTIILALTLIAFLATSCSPSGYGCKGRSKHITGYKGDKFMGY